MESVYTKICARKNPAEKDRYDIMAYGRDVGELNADLGPIIEIYMTDAERDNPLYLDERARTDDFAQKVLSSVKEINNLTPGYALLAEYEMIFSFSEYDELNSGPMTEQSIADWIRMYRLESTEPVRLLCLLRGYGVDTRTALEAMELVGSLIRDPRLSSGNDKLPKGRYGNKGVVATINQFGG